MPQVLPEWPRIIENPALPDAVKAEKTLSLMGKSPNFSPPGRYSRARR